MNLLLQVDAADRLALFLGLSESTNSVPNRRGQRLKYVIFTDSKESFVANEIVR